MSQRELLSDHITDAHSALTSKLSVARREAMMDPLTRLWNRRGASVLLKSAFEGADHRNSPMTIALLDLDNFKRINDSYGHQIGDEVLRKVASRLIGAVRNNDVVCRIGGDEFVILMCDTDAPDGRPHRRAHPPRGDRHARADARRHAADERERRLHGPVAEGRRAGRHAARARRPSPAPGEVGRPQPRPDDELKRRGRPAAPRPNRSIPHDALSRPRSSRAAEDLRPAENRPSGLAGLD